LIDRLIRRFQICLFNETQIYRGSYNFILTAYGDIFDEHIIEYCWELLIMNVHSPITIVSSVRATMPLSFVYLWEV